MEYKDYYKILGVERTADQDSIKQAFRRLAAKYHPDRNQEKGAEDRFKEINEANEVLSDTTKRARYDQLGAEWRAGQNFKPPPGWGKSSPQFDSSFFEGIARRGANTQQSSGFSDFFEGLFGGGFRRGSTGAQNASTSTQTTSTLQIELEDIYRGIKTVKLPSGGHVKIRIPPDISDDTKIRIPGKGPHGSDVYLKVKVNEHPTYRKEGSDIYLDLPITPWEAALGETITVTTLAGKISLKIPPGSQSGRKMRMKGRGLTGQEPGDLYIVLHIHTPPADTSEQKEYYARMKALFTWNPRQHLT
ncbi:DnaJ C-terminal domain-containing protein [Thiothrix lacustris]|uniref:DnaJ C-terminal domain-containing protein n=1 Tax=Thiothrix lacustris TaxID=525917 RepID=UPI0027E44EDC|nr:DnaJ C-terminal domain-containing protein [Thiothrix lacustris]WMP16271.1 DnaJ C-terminal domain-containing protein [Thiothrix lacustris]